MQGVDFTVDGREVGLYFVEQGDYFGELSVVDGQAGAEFVIAVAKSQVLFLPRDIARSFIFASPTVAEQMMLRLAQRVRAVTAQRILLSLPTHFNVCVLNFCNCLAKVSKRKSVIFQHNKSWRS